MRASARDARDALASGLGAAAATGIAARFMSSPLSALAAGTIVAGYMPMRSEIDPRLLMDRLAAAGSVLCLPDVVAEGTPLAFRRWVPDDPLDTGRYGISVPSPDADEMVPDLVLVPMLASAVVPSIRQNSRPRRRAPSLAFSMMGHNSSSR